MEHSHSHGSHGHSHYHPPVSCSPIVNNQQQSFNHSSAHLHASSYYVAPKTVKAAKVLGTILRNPRARRFLWFIPANTLLSLFLLHISFDSESHAFMALSVFSMFHNLAICAHLLTFWSLDQRPDEFHSFGQVRVEALAFFSVSLLTLLGAIICIKESGEHLLHNRDNDFLEEPVPVHISVFIALFLGLIFQLWFSLLANSTVLFKGAVRSFAPRPVPFLSSLSASINERNVHVIGGLSSYTCSILVYLIIR